MPIRGVMVNVYDILSYGLDRLRGRGLRKILGIDGTDTELWIDSGGYQFLSKGMHPDITKIAKVYREVDADYYISLDYPPSPRDSYDVRAFKITKTVSAFITLRDMLRTLAEEGRLIPVFHMSVGESLQLQLRVYEPHSVIAAAGGLIPYFMQRSGRGSRLKAVLFLALLRKLWKGKLHAMGLASAAIIPLLKSLGFDSGDTQTWRIKAAYGKIVIPGLGERHVSGKKARFGPATLSQEEELMLHKYLKRASDELGVDISLEDLVKDFKMRALFNSYILLYVAANAAAYSGPSKPFRRLYERAVEFASKDQALLEAHLGSLLYRQAEEAIRRTATAPVESISTSPPLGTATET